MVAFDGVWHSLLLLVVYLPATLEEALADLVVAEHTRLAGVGAGGGGLVGRGADAVLLGVGQGEATAVQGHAEDQLLSWGARLQPVLDGGVLKR